MKKILALIMSMVFMIPSTLHAINPMAADTVADVFAKQLSSELVEVVWGWEEIVPTSTFIDFETGDFSQGNFKNDEEYPWEITQDAYEGNYAVKSTNEGVDGGERFLNLEVDVPYDAVMSFYHKVSSEWACDGGVFYIDGKSKASMTGTDKDWEYVEVSVPAGKHTYTWGYFKDGSDLDGEDTYWVDNIVPFAPKEKISEGWLYYDDGVFANAAGMGSVGADNYWAVSFPDMSAYAGQTLTKVATMIYQGSNVTASVCLGGTDAPGEVVATKSFTATPEQVVEVELDTPVAIDGTQPLWIVMYCNDGTHPAAASAFCGDPNSSWFGYNNQWAPVENWGLTPMSWIIRGFVEDAEGRTTAISNDSDPASSRIAYEYNVHRRNIFTGDEAILITENVSDTVSVDDTWGEAESGIYQWGVEIVGGDGIVWSNPLDKDMFTTVEVSVSLNVEASVSNTEVTFVNITEPGKGFDYYAKLDNTGNYVWNEFRRGTYELTIYKKGYDFGKTEEVVEILDETSLQYVLTEILAPVENLRVSSSGYAEWEGVLLGDEFFFGFEDGTMDGWVTYDADADGNTWKHVWNFWGENYGYNSNASILSASYTNEIGVLYPDNYIVTEEKYLIGDASQLTFMVSPYDDDNPYEHYGVAVSTTGNTPEELVMVWEETLLAGKGGTRDTDAVRGQDINRIGNWYLRTVDLSAFAGQEVYIALRHFNCSDQYIFFIDDITLTNDAKSSRMIQSYTVLLNGVEEATVTELSYQHKNITIGETYTTTVIANYQSGKSEPVEYTWLYDGVSVDENNADAISVYPNPVKDNLTIAAENMKQITIVNTLGQVVLEQNAVSDNEVIDMTRYEAGVYMVRITTEAGVTVERIIVTK